MTDDLPPLPDQYDAAAHMYPWDIEDFQTGEKTGVVFSIPVGCPDGKSVPLWTSEQMRAYARAAVLAERERWEERLEDADNRYHLLASELVYEGTSVQHWRSKAKAYGDAIMQIWDVLREAGYPPGQGKKVVEVVADAIRKGTP